jgi:putative FmdB family regulatory protein
MPTYEYECTQCGHTFEEFQSMTADPLIQCPECHEAGLRRLIGGGVGIIFKGSGFYVTDSKKSGSNGKSGSASRNSGSEQNSTDTTGEGKSGASSGSSDTSSGTA